MTHHWPGTTHNWAAVIHHQTTATHSQAAMTHHCAAVSHHQTAMTHHRPAVTCNWSARTRIIEHLLWCAWFWCRTDYCMIILWPLPMYLLQDNIMSRQLLGSATSYCCTMMVLRAWYACFLTLTAHALLPPVEFELLPVEHVLSALSVLSSTLLPTCLLSLLRKPRSCLSGGACKWCFVYAQHSWSVRVDRKLGMWESKLNCKDTWCFDAWSGRGEKDSTRVTSVLYRGMHWYMQVSWQWSHKWLLFMQVLA